MDITVWFQNNYIEIFGAVAGIIYVFLEIRQNIWLWPVGIVTSSVYIWVFFTSKFYADMSLQGYYLVISILGWYWWVRKSESGGTGEGENGRGGEEERGRSERSGRGRKGEREKRRGGERELKVTRLKFRTGVIVAVTFVVLYGVMWMVLSRFTDSPVPGWDSFITSLSVVATWMLARKIYEHWYLWIVVNGVSAAIFFTRELYPTVILYIVYGVMSFAGLIEWRKTLSSETLKP